MKSVIVGAIAACVFSLAAEPARAEMAFMEGVWRVDISGTAGLDAGRRDRSEDALFTGHVEYEFPAMAHLTLGLRLLPLFVYHQDEGDTVYGGGAGFAARLYERNDGGVYKGFFAEVFGDAVGHANRIVGNSSHFNFLVGGGIGYKFDQNWHLSVQFQHVSNAGIGSSNQDVNSIGLGGGFSF